MRPARLLDPAALGRAFAVAGDQVRDGEVPFAILVVATADDVVRAEAIPGPGAPGIGLATICPLASITKPIVATAILQLVAEGRISLGDPVDLHVPELAAPDKPRLTVWHLLSHTSGLPDYDLDALLASRPDRQTLLGWITSADLQFAPGSRFEYISSSFELLGLVLERIRGETLEAALRRTILDPLGMVDTTFAPRGEQLARVVLPAGVGDGGGAAWEARLPRFDEARYVAGLTLAGGGLLSTAGDLVRFGRAMLRGGELDGARILPPAFVDLATREQTTGTLGTADDPAAAHHYALGWGKPDPRTTPGSPAAFGHGGATTTALWIDPEHDLVVVYLSSIVGLVRRPFDRVLAAVYAALRDG